MVFFSVSFHPHSCTDLFVRYRYIHTRAASRVCPYPMRTIIYVTIHLSIPPFPHQNRCLDRWMGYIYIQTFQEIRYPLSEATPWLSTGGNPLGEISIVTKLLLCPWAYICNIYWCIRLGANSVPDCRNGFGSSSDGILIKLMVSILCFGEFCEHVVDCIHFRSQVIVRNGMMRTSRSHPCVCLY